MPFKIHKYENILDPKDARYSELASFKASAIHTFCQEAIAMALSDLRIHEAPVPDRPRGDNSVMLSTTFVVGQPEDLDKVRTALWSLVKAAQLAGDHHPLQHLSEIYRTIFGTEIPFSKIAEIPVRNEAHS